jgi:predicted N-formylglutamate amidohydrolase
MRGPDQTFRLLGPDEPPAVLEEGLQRQSCFVIVVDHGSAHIPRRLGDLGLMRRELRRHIAWDIGALAVARAVAAAIDAPLIAQNYSRLVIDCNRDPDIASSIPTVSETATIPGNTGLSAEEIEARRNEIFWPYHRRLKGLLNERRAAGRSTILVSQHSMTAVYHGVSRPMHAAVLYNKDGRFAALMLEELRRDQSLIVADNEPYFVSDATDYTIPVHGEARGLPHVELEIRQDLIDTESGQNEWATRIAAALQSAERQFSSGT